MRITENMLGIKCLIATHFSENCRQHIYLMNYAVNARVETHALPLKCSSRFVKFSQNLNVYTTYKGLSVKFNESNFIVSRDNYRKTKKLQVNRCN
jgi:hypothetical protein